MTQPLLCIQTSRWCLPRLHSKRFSIGSLRSGNGFRPAARPMRKPTALRRPVLEASNRVIRQLRAALGRDFPIVGVGGIMSAKDAVSKIEAGADVVQIYTGLIYEGPALVEQAAKAIKASRIKR